MHGAVFQVRDRQGFDGITQFLGVAEVLRLKFGYPFAENVGVLERTPVGQRRKDGQFIGGVDALYVIGWVSLGVSQVLGLA